ncbi:MAG: sialidase, partial [Acidobacteriota bacterium]
MFANLIAIILVSLFSLPQAAGGGPEASPKAPRVVKSEFIYETAPFPECHAATIAETDRGLVAAWFGGTKEKNPDVGI